MTPGIYASWINKKAAHWNTLRNTNWLVAPICCMMFLRYLAPRRHSSKYCGCPLMVRIDIHFSSICNNRSMQWQVNLYGHVLCTLHTYRWHCWHGSDHVHWSLRSHCWLLPLHSKPWWNDHCYRWLSNRLTVPWIKWCHCIRRLFPLNGTLRSRSAWFWLSHTSITSNTTTHLDGAISRSTCESITMRNDREHIILQKGVGLVSTQYGK